MRESAKEERESAKEERESAKEERESAKEERERGGGKEVGPMSQERGEREEGVGVNKQVQKTGKDTAYKIQYYT